MRCFTGLINEGWGIHIIEGPNWFVVGMINLFMMTLSGLAAGLWKLYMDDFQGAFWIRRVDCGRRECGFVCVYCEVG